jgi:3D (Asp-Asp-Asp) domain-containing protein
MKILISTIQKRCASTWSSLHTAVSVALKKAVSPLTKLFSKTSSMTRRVIAGVCAILLMLPLCLKQVVVAQAVYLVGGNNDVIVIDNNEPTATYTSQMLQINDTQGGSDAQIVLSDKTPVTILRGDDVREAQSRNETVANLLRRLDISIGDNEMVAVDIAEDHVQIRIGASLTFYRDEVVETDFETEYVADPNADQGTDTVLQAGVKGNVTQTYLDTYENGQVVSSEFVRQTDDNAVTQIISRGTRVQSVDRSARITNVSYRDDGTGYLTFNTGETMDFTSVMDCEATAYSGGSRTASGRPTCVGNIAVDPSVIPYGTQMFIQTPSGSIVYGMATAADCGSAIKGNIIDLWFETYDESCRWGRRACTVYILS